MKYMLCVDNSTSCCRKAFEFLCKLVKPEDTIIFLCIGPYSRPIVVNHNDLETEKKK